MSQSAPTTAKPPSAGKKYVIMLIVLVGTFMSVLDGAVVNIALPTITAHFHVALSSSQWIVTAYLLTLTSLLLVFGKVSEFTGKARLFTTGFSIFTLSSLACGLSGNLAQLIIFRVFQATGAAMVFGISAAILYQTFPPQERGRAMGYLGSTVAIGSITGPIIGGFLVDAFGWEYIFFVNVPIGIIVVSAALRHLKLQEERSRNFNLDWPGAAMLVLSMSALVIFLGDLAQNPKADASLLAPGAIFIFVFIAFIIRERSCPSPLLKLSVFRNLRFSLPILSMIFYFMATFIINLVGPFYFEGVVGFDPSQVGMVFMVVPSIMVVAAPIGGWLYDKHYSRFYAALGQGIMTLAYVLYGILAPHAYLPGIISAFVLIGVGGALFQSPNGTEIMHALPKEESALASSLMATMRNFGMSMGVSLGSIMISLQVHWAGYGNDVLAVEKDTLAGIVGNSLFAAAGVVCLGAVISLASVRWRRPPMHAEAGGD